MIHKPVLELLLHNIRSVYNTAAIFRTAECLGVKKIWLSGYTPAPIDRFGRMRDDFHKVALGTETIIVWEQIDNVKDLILEKKVENFRVVGLEQSPNSVLLQDYLVESNVLLIPGTETTGLEQNIIELCDNLIEITQVGQKESLNIQSATAIALWKLLV